MSHKLALLRALSLSSLLWAFPSSAEDGQLSGNEIEHVFSGNTAATFFTSNGSKALSLFAKNHQLITQSVRRGNYPFYNGDWFVSDDNLCIKSNNPTICSRIEASGDHYVGFTDVNGRETAAFEFQFYQGDPSHLMSGYQTKEVRQWAYGIAIIGIVGSAIVNEASGSSQTPDSWGFHGECHRSSWQGNPFCGPPPSE